MEKVSKYYLSTNASKITNSTYTSKIHLNLQEIHLKSYLMKSVKSYILCIEQKKNTKKSMQYN